MSNKISLIYRLVFYIAAVIVFLAVPTSVVEGGTLCIIYHITGYKCPMCGMTRAFSNAMHFEFLRAISFNPLITIIFPLFWFLFIDDVVSFISLICGKSYRSCLDRLLYYKKR